MSLKYCQLKDVLFYGKHDGVYRNSGMHKGNNNCIVSRLLWIPAVPQLVDDPINFTDIKY